MSTRFITLLICFILLNFIACKSDNSTSVNEANLKKIEAITLLGDTLFSFSKQSDKLLESYHSALDEYKVNPDDADANIWYGRRVAYMGRYREAISIFAEAIEKFPKDARMYRHRGHRYISIREYDKAIQDLEKACELIRTQKNEIEPDGIPNKRGIPVSTLHGNIYYHLALAYYLKGDFQNALGRYDLCMASNQNDDNVVSTAHWKYMTLRRMALHDEAERLIKPINGSMDIMENITYFEICLFYKGVVNEEWFEKKLIGGSADDVFLYGLGNWNLYHKKDTTRAKECFDRLLENGNKASFAYLAAEADCHRLFDKPLKVQK